jgi:hypothetical protein
MTLHRKVRGTVAGVLAAVVTALVPAAASAAPEWQRLPDPPGGDAFALVGGVPMTAYATTAGVRVVRPTVSGDAWRFVGGPIRREAGHEVREPSIAEGPDGRPWVAWTELDSSGRVRQARVAKLVGTTWRMVGGQINVPIDPDRGPASANDPQLAFFEDTPYVAYLQDNPAETSISVVRLSADGSTWERISPPGGPDSRARIVASGGRLYVTKVVRTLPAVLAYRLKPDGTGWEDAGAPSSPELSSSGELAAVGGAPAVFFADHDTGDLVVSSLGADDTWAPLGGGPLAAGSGSVESLAGVGEVPYAAWLDGGALNVSFVEDGSWAQTPSPGMAGSDATLARLASGRTDLFIMWKETTTGATTTHVAKLGEPYVPPPDDGSDDTGGDEDTPPGPPEPPAPAPTGHCRNVITGTASGNVLNGTALSDSISGLGGRDLLYGNGGDDCLFGGNGPDILFGQGGGDTMFGGNGGDELQGGRGDDDLNGRAGNDFITGGPGQDAVGGGSGNDHIDVRGGGPDLVACGSGRDTVRVDRSDGTRGCERIVRR